MRKYTAMQPDEDADEAGRHPGKTKSSLPQLSAGDTSGLPLLSALTTPISCLLRTGSEPNGIGRCNNCNVRGCTVHAALGALQLSIVVYKSSTADGPAAATSNGRLNT
jgi:hypothetical protein